MGDAQGVLPQGGHCCQPWVPLSCRGLLWRCHGLDEEPAAGVMPPIPCHSPPSLCTSPLRAHGWSILPGMRMDAPAQPSLSRVGSSHCPGALFREPLKAALRWATRVLLPAGAGGSGLWQVPSGSSSPGEGWGLLTDPAWPPNPGNWGFSRSNTIPGLSKRPGKTLSAGPPGSSELTWGAWARDMKRPLGRG